MLKIEDALNCRSLRVFFHMPYVRIGLLHVFQLFAPGDSWRLTGIVFSQLLLWNTLSCFWKMEDVFFFCPRWKCFFNYLMLKLGPSRLNSTSLCLFFLMRRHCLFSSFAAIYLELCFKNWKGFCFCRRRCSFFEYCWPNVLIQASID